MMDGFGGHGWGIGWSWIIGVLIFNSCSLDNIQSR